MTKEIMKGSADYHTIKPLDYTKFLVLSFGTGSPKVEEIKYSAEEAAKWGVFGWLTSHGSTPLVDVFTQASADMVDIHMEAVFRALSLESRYLRIQV